VVELAISMIRLSLRSTFGLVAMMVWACTLGKVDPRTRRFV
jgi:hypothetical protein